MATETPEYSIQSLPPDDSMSTRDSARVAWITVLTVMTAMLLWTWGTWPDPTIDFGTQLYLPWRINAGEVLYRDLAYFKGPFSAYFNALVFAILGTSLRSLVIVNLIIWLTTLWLLWRLLRHFTDVISAAGCLLLAVLVFGFLQYRYFGNYNWITPYAHEYTHGIAMSLGVLLALQRLARNGRLAWAVLAGALCGLVFLTTAEVFAACVAAAATRLGLGLLPSTRRQPIKVLAVLVFAACTVAVPMFAFALLVRVMPWADALRGVLGSWTWVFDVRISDLGFYRASMGLDDADVRLRRMVVILIGELIFFSLAFFIARSIPNLQWRRPARMLTIAGAMVCGVAVGWFAPTAFPWNEFALPLPLVVIVIFLLSAGKAWRIRDDRVAARATFSIFAFVLLGKIVLHARVQHYGFTLALPAAMLVVVILVGTIPGWLESRGRAGKTFRAISIAALSAYAVGLLYGHHLFAKDKQIPVASGGDAFLADARGQQVNSALQWLDKRANPGDTLAFLPQGLMINYLARLPHPNRYLNFMPPEVISAGEETIIQAYRDNPPTWIILARANVKDDAFYLLDGEYAYGGDMLHWVEDHYEAAGLIHNPATYPSGEWLILRRTSGATNQTAPSSKAAPVPPKPAVRSDAARH